jgi:putative radical SAM enzyme (TIGR03279 family)
MLLKEMVKKGINIISVDRNSIAFAAGIRHGDALVSINGNAISDPIDYRFYEAEEFLKVEIICDGALKEVVIEKAEDEDIGLEFDSMRIKRCPNKCVFCFVDQMPEGCRESLYIKDEDYRFSFLYGSYITLTNLTKKDKERIFSQRLSPLYISVHATDNELRREMVGNKKSPDILKEIEEFAQHRIFLHTQIVLCPGINDKEYLKKSINDLKGFYPYVSSIAIVPVGQTRHRVKKLTPVDEDYAKKTITLLTKIKADIKKEIGDDILFIADEFYIKAGMEFPEINEYADFPQVENGVGLVPLFLSEFEDALNRIKKKPDACKRFIAITGESFALYLKECVAKLKNYSIDIDVIAIKNSFLGESVTVAGLLTGQDILIALKDIDDKKTVLIPSVSLREATDRFLDDMTVEELRKKSGMEIEVVQADAEGLITHLLKI